MGKTVQHAAAILLSGGLMRGVFQGGFCYARRRMEEAGICPRGDIVALSVGVCSGQFSATGNVEGPSAIWRDDVHGNQLIVWRWGWPRMRTHHLLARFQHHLQLAALGAHGKFTCVLTDLEFGEPVYLEVGPQSPIWRIILASIAIPPLVEPVEIEGIWYGDGGLSDPLPRPRDATEMVALGICGGVPCVQSEAV